MRENIKGIRHGALSKSFVTSHYPFLFLAQLRNYARPEKLFLFRYSLYELI